MQYFVLVDYFLDGHCHSAAPGADDGLHLLIQDQRSGLSCTHIGFGLSVAEMKFDGVLTKQSTALIDFCSNERQPLDRAFRVVSAGPGCRQTHTDSIWLACPSGDEPRHHCHNARGN